MAEMNDHDLLVRLDAKVEMLITSQTSFIQAMTSQTKELAERIARLEVKDSRDSEKVQSISEDVRRSLGNAARIDTLIADVENLEGAVKDLKAKSNLWDVTNSIAVAIAGAIGWFMK
jgi:uncharacterized protein YoxC